MSKKNEAPTSPLSSLTLVELRKIIKSNNIIVKNISAIKKADLIKIVEENKIELVVEEVKNKNNKVTTLTKKDDNNNKIINTKKARQPVGSANSDDVNIMKCIDVLKELHKYDKYKGLSDYLIKKKIGNGKIPNVSQLRDELSILRKEFGKPKPKVPKPKVSKPKVEKEKPKIEEKEKSKPESKAEKKKPEPKVEKVKSKPEPKAEKKKPEPKVEKVKSKVEKEKSKVKSKPEPKVEKVKSKVEKKKPELKAEKVKSKPEPKTEKVKSKPEPKTEKVKSKPEPKVEKEKSKVEKKKPTTEPEKEEPDNEEITKIKEQKVILDVEDNNLEKSINIETKIPITEDGTSFLFGEVINDTTKKIVSPQVIELLNKMILYVIGAITKRAYNFDSLDNFTKKIRIIFPEGLADHIISNVVGSDDKNKTETNKFRRIIIENNLFFVNYSESYEEQLLNMCRILYYLCKEIIDAISIDKDEGEDDIEIKDLNKVLKEDKDMLELWEKMGLELQ